MTKTRQLAKLAERPPVKAGPIEKLIGASTAQPGQAFRPAAEPADDHDLHVGIIRHLKLDFSLGAALEQIGEARRLTGTDRRAKIERAIRYLTEELQHC